MKNWTQHTQIALEVAFYTFAANYVQSPSVTSYLHGHAWAADLIASLWTAFRVYQTYTPTNPAQPGKES